MLFKVLIMQSTEQQKELLERIANCLNKKGINIHSPCIFQITKSSPERIKFALDVKGVKYYELNAENKILLEEQSFEKCVKIEEENHSKGFFFQEFEHGELRKTLTNIFNEECKMFTINNIPSELSEALENKLMTVKKGLLIEHTDYENNTFSISVAEKMLTPNEKEKFIDAYLESFIVTYGANAHFKIEPTLECNSFDYQVAVAEHRFIDKLFETAKEETRKEVSIETDIETYFKTYRNNCILNLEKLKQNQKVPLELASSYKDVTDLQYAPYDYALISLNTYSPNFDKEQELETTKDKNIVEREVDAR